MSVSLQYTRSMAAILDRWTALDCDCVTVGYLTEQVDYSRETVRRNLKELAADGCVELVHATTALYRLKYDPRSED